MKKVLVIYYTQTGQQKEIAEHIVMPLVADPEVEVTYHQIRPKKEYPFPWDKNDFFDAFPESFLQIPCALEPVSPAVLSDTYDLIILSYQVWYLSPSIPVNSFLRSAEAHTLLHGKPVVTVVGCRNMWVTAQEKVKLLLNNASAHLVGNIALADRHLNHVSLITLVRWMMKGKKDVYLGIFPKPGVSEKEIRESSRFGETLLAHLKIGNFETLQSQLISQKAVVVKPLLVFIDKRGNFMFSKWSKKIRKKGIPGDPARKPWLKLFNYYLFVALWFAAPIVSLLFLILHLPFISRIRRGIKYYQSVSLK